METTGVDLPAQTSALFASGSRFKMAPFAINYRRGGAPTTGKGSIETLFWPEQVRIAQMAETAGFEAIIALRGGVDTPALPIGLARLVKQYLGRLTLPLPPIASWCFQRSSHRSITRCRLPSSQARLTTFQVGVWLSTLCPTGTLKNVTCSIICSASMTTAMPTLRSGLGP